MVTIVRPHNKYMQTDCFAFCQSDRGCSCKALNDIYCSTGKVCSFYKSVAEEAKQRKASEEKFKKSLKV